MLPVSLLPEAADELDAAVDWYEDRAAGRTRKELEPMLGSRARVSELLNRKRPLSLAMIRRLRDGLGISADLLVGRDERG